MPHHRSSGIDCLGIGWVVHIIKSDVSLRRFYEKRLTKTPRPRDEQHPTLGLHHRSDESRFINVIAMIPNHVRKIFAADSQFLVHRISFEKQNVIVVYFTNSGVKPRRLGRGYKPRKPGADFI